MKRLLFIYNPHAGKELLKPKLSDIIDIFVKAGYEVVVFNRSKESVRELAAEGAIAAASVAEVASQCEVIITIRMNMTW